MGALKAPSGKTDITCQAENHRGSAKGALSKDPGNASDKKGRRSSQGHYLD